MNSEGLLGHMRPRAQVFCGLEDFQVLQCSVNLKALGFTQFIEGWGGGGSQNELNIIALASFLLLKDILSSQQGIELNPK